MQSAAEFRDWLEAPIDGNVASCEALLDRPHDYLVISAAALTSRAVRGCLLDRCRRNDRNIYRLPEP